MDEERSQQQVARDGTGASDGLGSGDGLGARLVRDRDLRGTRFVGCDLSGVVVRGSDVAGMEIDSPWLMEGGSRLVVNGVDVVPLVDAELNRRFPGRELRSASSPSGLRDAWAAVERAWAATLERASLMQPGTVDRSVDAEVLDARAGRQGMVRDLLARLTAPELAEPRRNPHAPEHAETVLSCLHTILEEEWEHHRYAVRDLDSLAMGGR